MGVLCLVLQRGFSSIAGKLEENSRHLDSDPLQRPGGLGVQECCVQGWLGSGPRRLWVYTRLSSLPDLHLPQEMEFYMRTFSHVRPEPPGQVRPAAVSAK